VSSQFFADGLFYVLSAVALLCALGVILAKSAMGSVIALLGAFFALSIIYLLAGFQFLAAAQVLVYGGAILVLFLFVIMLLNLDAMGHKFELRTTVFQGRRAHFATVVAVGVALVALIAAQRAELSRAVEATPQGGLDDIGDIAIALFGRYSLPFQAASLMLLATIVAVIVLAKRQKSLASERKDAGDAR
jgi:NADH-quinone oxidoreductase subunit J